MFLAVNFSLLNKEKFERKDVNYGDMKMNLVILIKFIIYNIYLNESKIKNKFIRLFKNRIKILF